MAARRPTALAYDDSFALDDVYDEPAADPWEDGGQLASEGPLRVCLTCGASPPAGPGCDHPAIAALEQAPADVVAAAQRFAIAARAYRDCERAFKRLITREQEAGRAEVTAPPPPPPRPVPAAPAPPCLRCGFPDAPPPARAARRAPSGAAGQTLFSFVGSKSTNESGSPPPSAPPDGAALNPDAAPSFENLAVDPNTSSPTEGLAVDPNASPPSESLAFGAGAPPLESVATDSGAPAECLTDAPDQGPAVRLDTPSSAEDLDIDSGAFSPAEPLAPESSSLTRSPSVDPEAPSSSEPLAPNPVVSGSGGSSFRPNAARDEGPAPANAPRTEAVVDGTTAQPDESNVGTEALVAFDPWPAWSPYPLSPPASPAPAAFDSEGAGEGQLPAATSAKAATRGAAKAAPAPTDKTAPGAAAKAPRARRKRSPAEGGGVELPSRRARACDRHGANRTEGNEPRKGVWYERRPLWLARHRPALASAPALRFRQKATVRRRGARLRRTSPLGRKARAAGDGARCRSYGPPSAALLAGAGARRSGALPPPW